MDKMKRANEIWVGKYDVEDGDTVVFDPDLQVKQSDRLYLFSLRSESIVTHYPHHIRRYMKRTSDVPLRSRAISSYYRWKMEHAEEFVATESLAVQARNIENAKKERESELKLQQKTEAARLETIKAYKAHIIEKHRSNITSLGVEYRGVQVSKKRRKRRTANCYACQSPLDNYFDLECVKCGWIVCDCGACGCGWKGS